MVGIGLDDAIRLRASEVGCVLSPDQVRRLSLFLQILGRWNAKLNLTALVVESPDLAAIDRLVVEPCVAAKELHEDELVVVDVGSGSGSPALPFYVQAGSISITLVESRSRKAAFLREAAREIQATGVRVEVSRIEDLAKQPLWVARAHVVTMRAVRPDERVLDAIASMLRPSGRLFYFHSDSHVEHGMLVHPTLNFVQTLPLLASNRSALSIFQRTTN